MNQNIYEITWLRSALQSLDISFVKLIAGFCKKDNAVI